jgi:hypothetical protein
MVLDNMFLHIQFAGNVLHEQFRQSLRVNKTNRHLLVSKMHISVFVIIGLGSWSILARFVR